MIRSALLSILLLLTAEAVAVGPDHYTEIGHWPRESVLAAALSDEQLLFLLGSAIGSADRSQEGLKLEPSAPVALQRSYENTVLAGNWLYLTDLNGYLGVCRVRQQSLEVVAETRITDTIFAAAAAGRYLYLASGAAGLRVIDVGQKNKPRLIGTLQPGVRYTDLLVSGDRLFAVDILNGVEAFDIVDSLPVHRQTYYSDAPVSDLAFLPPHLFTAAENGVLLRHLLSEAGELLSKDEVTLSAPVTALAVTGDVLVVAFANGKLQTFDSAEREVRDSLQLPFPAMSLHALAGGEAAALVVTDARGLVHEITLEGSEFVKRRSVNLAGAVEALWPQAERLYAAAAAGGILETGYNESGLVSRHLLAKGTVYSSLAGQNDKLFAAENGDPALHLLSTDGSSHTSLEWQLPAGELLLQELSDQQTAIVSLGITGAQAAVESDGDLQSAWTMPMGKRLLTGFLSSGILGMLDEQFVLQLYTPGDYSAPPQFVTEFNLPESTRVLLYLPEGFLVAAGSDGVSVFSLQAPYSDLVWLRDFAGFEDIHSLAYEPNSRVLVGALGQEGAFYLDFSEPAEGATAYLLPGLTGVSHVVASGDYLYLKADDGIHAFLTSESIEPPQPAVPGNFTISESYPNPFNLRARIAVSAPPGQLLSGELEFEVYNILGQRLWQERSLLSGSQVYLDWNGRSAAGHRAPSGLYLLVVSSGDFSTVRKAVLLK